MHSKVIFFSVSYVVLLGNVLFTCGDKEAGLDCLHKAMNLASSHPVDISWPSFHWDVLIDLAMAYLSIGNIDMAKVYGGQAIRAAPDSVMARAVLMRIDRACKNYQCHDSGSLPLRLRGVGKTPLFVRIYQLKVVVSNWPNKRAVIEINGNESLSSLQKIISRAFNRSDSYPYRFLSGDGLYDETGEQIVAELDGHREVSYENCTRIDTLCRRLGQRFFCIFEDGNSLWHEVVVIGLRYEVACFKYPYPRVVRRNGSLPTLYPCEFSLKVPTPWALEGAFSSS